MTNVGKFFTTKQFYDDTSAPNLEKLIILKSKLYIWLNAIDNVLVDAGLNKPSAVMWYEPIRNLPDAEIKARQLLKKVKKGILKLTWNKKPREY